MKRHFQKRDVFEFAIPRSLDRLLGMSENYRAWRRRQVRKDPDFSPSISIPEFPKWRGQFHYNGYGSLLTRHKGTYYSIDLTFREHLHPSHGVTMSYWMIETTPNMHLSNKTKVFDQHWKEMDEQFFLTLEEAEAYRDHLIETFEDRLMEAAL